MEFVSALILVLLYPIKKQVTIILFIVLINAVIYIFQMPTKLVKHVLKVA